jgi:hypothetical protein
MVVKTVEALKAEQIGNICLFADTAGVFGSLHACHASCVCKAGIAGSSNRSGAVAVVGFYEQLGFKADPDGVRGMFWNQRP